MADSEEKKETAGTTSTTGTTSTASTTGTTATTDQNYEVDSYGKMSEAIGTTNSFRGELETLKDTITEIKTILSDESIFMGPAAERSTSDVGSLITKMDGLITDFNTISTYLGQAQEEYKSGDSSASQGVLSVGDNGRVEISLPSSTTSSNTVSSGLDASGKIVTNGNVIDVSKPVYKTTGYNLTDEEIRYLAGVARREQGSVGGSKLELTLMANLYEKNKSKYKNVVDYVKRSGWFSSGSLKSYSNPGDDYVRVAREILNGGDRYAPANIVEHDWIGDITSISTGSKSNRSNYIPGKTIIKNKYGAKYMFVGFAPNKGDPFGYLL